MSWIHQQQPPPSLPQHPATKHFSQPPAATATSGSLTHKTVTNSAFMQSTTVAGAGVASYSNSLPPSSQQQPQLAQQHPPQQHQHQYHSQMQSQPPTTATNWQQPQTQAQHSYLQQNNMMQPTTNANNWPQPQQTHQQPQTNVNNMYQQQQQQQVPNQQQYAQTTTNWQQNDLQSVPPPNSQSNYSNYFAATMQPQHQQHFNATPEATNFNQNIPQQQPGVVNNSMESFDRSNDGWGDWDWNDNSHNAATQQQSVHAQQQQQQQMGNLNNNLADSFTVQTGSNDNWNWVAQQESNTNSSVDMPKSTAVSDATLATETNNYQITAASMETVAHPADSTKTTISAETNVPLTTAHSNIPTNAAPTYESSSETPLLAPPPQEFQNEPLNEQSLPSLPSQMPNFQAPPPVMTPPLVLPPAAMGGATAANPFKRAGNAQHHRASLIAAPAATSMALPPLDATANPMNIPPAGVAVCPPAPAGSEPYVPSAEELSNLSLPPYPYSPPADFANTLTAHEQNTEHLPENQEVLSYTTMPVPNITLPGGKSIQSNQVNQTATPPQPQHHHHPNDERNQYLQTSHLSENLDEELNIEGDNVLPPPGLSRLVLGQPELSDPTQQQQRLVTGTEEPNASAVNMNIEERHADGEDTSVEQQPIIVMNNNNNLISNSNNTHLMPSNDRNMYLAGESNGTPQQRVVTGSVETSSDVLTAPNNEQRDIDLDGENVDDQPLPAAVPLGAVASRNDPPLEGASHNSTTNVANTSLNMGSLTTDVHAAKSKDLSNQSTGNDESEHEHRYAGNKSRKAAHSDGSRKHDKRDKRRSADRYNSEASEEEEYSSDREREQERRRSYREGSARSERDEREYREARRHNSKREKERDKYYHAEQQKSERRSQRHRRGGYEDSKYETEESRSKDERGGGRSDRSDRDYEDYQRRYRGSRRGGGGGSGADKTAALEQDRIRAGERKNDRDYNTTMERRRRDKRDYEEYRKQSSRNARDSDLDAKERERGHRSGAAANARFDPRHAAAAMYGFHPNSGAAYGYDPYAYYYEQMARTNPQAYAEWYKKYYGTHAAHASAATNSAAATTAANVDHLTTAGSSLLAATDGRESVHSGRSSAHNDKDRSGNMSLRERERDPEPADPQRLTPCKFIREHTIASLGAGILVTMKPKYTSSGNISTVVKMLRMCPNDATRQLFHSYPGPLIRGLTHKKTIIEFCEEQIRQGPSQTTIYAKQLMPRNVEKYTASYTLMWNLLILLLRQNGMVVGTDIAELLLKNQQHFPYEPHNALQTPKSSNSAASLQSHESDNEEKEHENDGPNNHNEEAEENSEISKSNTDSAELSSSAQKSSAAITEEEITEKFRNYLLYGNVNEALEWATDNNLWGHALFLASKLDRRSHANIMMKFANKLSLNDPLQTLYQLMSGRTPSSVTSVQDEKWGDWRPHLSMILSNTSQKPELDRKAITTLGDSLFNRGDLFAAHFCYLMAQVGFGRYQSSATQESTLQHSLAKLVLLGSSHYKQFRDFATNEAIMMTEIYEYACSLNDDKFSLVEFQPYKYLLASRMLDYGNHLRSLMYMEQVSVHIEKDPSKYEPSFINKVFELADRLKYYDPALEKTSLDDQQLLGNQQLDGNLSGSLQQSFEEQKWLQNLRSLAVQYRLDYNNAGTFNAAGSAEPHDYQLSQNQIDQQFMEINKQFNQLNLQYDAVGAEAAAVPTFYNPDAMQQHSMTAAAADINDQQQHQYQLPPQTQATANEYETQQQAYNANATLDQPPAHHEEATTNAYYAQQQYMQPDHLQLQQQQQQQPPQNTYYDPSQQYNAEQAVDASSASYDYWQQQQQQQPQMAEENAPRPTISMPKSKSYDSEDDAKQKASKGSSQQQQQKASAKSESKDANKSGQQNSGWFGGIWNKLSMKPKNQMILPDDKNPSIVWDADKKRWINTDGEEAEADSLKPPPKMSDLMPQTQQQQQQQLPQAPQFAQQYQQQQQPIQQQYQAPLMNTSPLAAASVMPAAAHHNLGQQPIPNTAAAVVSPSGFSASAAATTTTTTPFDASAHAAPKPPSLQSNMFKMQRNRTLKNSYVDVFNPSGAPMSKASENIMAPELPPAAVPQGGFFIPGAAPAADGGGSAAYQQQETPQFYNPNQYAGTGGGY